jgi:tetratricopeptide (TPR) repeat protein
MFATAICVMGRWTRGHKRLNTAQALPVLLGIFFLFAGARQPFAADSNPFAMRAQTNFAAAQKRFLSETNSAQAAWEFGRACFDLADSATNNIEKARVAEQGIVACHQALALDPKCGPAHMYLGMTIGQVADTKRNLAALKMVKEMEREFQAARELDEHFDYAGADRNLGLLYFESPAIISVGNRTKAKLHLQRAVQLAPDYPDNRLNLIDAYLKWNEHDAARRELKALEKTWPQAKEKFPNENWPNLERRFEATRKKVESADK